MRTEDERQMSTDSKREFVEVIWYQIRIRIGGTKYYTNLLEEDIAGDGVQYDILAYCIISTNSSDRALNRP